MYKVPLPALAAARLDVQHIIAGNADAIQHALIDTAQVFDRNFRKLAGLAAICSAIALACFAF